MGDYFINEEIGNDESRTELRKQAKKERKQFFRLYIAPHSLILLKYMKTGQVQWRATTL